MATLTVWKVDDPDTATSVRDRLLGLQSELGDVSGELIATNLGVDDEVALKELFQD